jgi:hypothetical protein
MVAGPDGIKGRNDLVIEWAAKTFHVQTIIAA